MCIYLKNKEGLCYEKQEHVLPAALGCCTKLDKGIVSDQANEYFSPIERDVIKNSFIQIPRIIDGPGKRGKLSPKYATTSNVMVIEHGGETCLGYMKGEKGYILDQFVIRKLNDIQFIPHSIESDVQKSIDFLKEKIVNMKDKYVPVDLLHNVSESIFFTFYDGKIHIGYSGELPQKKLDDIIDVFRNEFTQRKMKLVEGGISGILEVKENIINISKVVAKSAVNTLAFLKGAECIKRTTDFEAIIKKIFSENDEILSVVSTMENADIAKQSFKLKDDQQACLIFCEGKKLTSWVFFYNRLWEVELCDNLSMSFELIFDGIVCDWKNRRDYRYQEYLESQKNN